MFKLCFSTLIVIFLFNQYSFGEKIYLKTGIIVEGDLVESNKRFIKVNYQGVPLTYWQQDIERIESSNEEFGQDSDVVIKLKGAKDKASSNSLNSYRAKKKTSKTTRKSCRVKRSTCRRRCRRSGL